MLTRDTPLTIVTREAVWLRAMLPKIRDGETEAVHDARIASRRVRETLPLAEEWHRRGGQDLEAGFKRMGRWLGRVRDADAAVDLLKYFEARVPQAAPALVVLRQTREAARLRLMRRLIKKFERLHVEQLLESAPAQFSHVAVRHWLAGAPWRERLRHQIRERAESAVAAIERAGGVYFPNRLHCARIAVKKLRYATELADRTGLGAPEGAARELKKAQDLLGDIHDRQLLIDELATAGDAARPAQIDAVVQVATAEIRALHARYLERRDRLLAVCAASDEQAGARGRIAPALPVLAAAAAVASGWLLNRAAKPPREPLVRRGERVEVRIPIDADASVRREPVA